MSNPWRTPKRDLLETGPGGVEAKCGERAKRRGYWHRKFKSPSNRSVPDRVFARSGTVFWVEFKRKGKKATEAQQEQIDLMLTAGLRVYLIDCIEDFDNLLDMYDAEWLR